MYIIYYIYFNIYYIHFTIFIKIKANLEVLGVYLDDILYIRYNAIDEIFKCISTDIKNLNNVLKVIPDGPLR